MNATDVIDYQTKLMTLVKDIDERGLRKTFDNGVGSKIVFLRRFTPPEDIREMFAYPAFVHDVAYWVGGTPWHKAQADAFFFALCMDRAYDVKGFVSRLRVRAWAQVAQLAVRVGGEVSFEKRKEPCWNLQTLVIEAKKESFGIL